MEEFVSLNYGLCITTLVAIVIIIGRNRFLLVKPSICVVLFYHVLIQWPATILSDNTFWILPQPYDFLLLTHGFPLVGLLGGALILRGDATAVWQQLHPNVQLKAGPPHRKDIGALISIWCVILVMYLAYVGPSQTGLAALVTIKDSMLIAIARENSMKLLPAIIRYPSSFMTTTLAWLLASMLSLVAIDLFRKGRVFAATGLGIMVIIVAISAAVSGARGPAAMVLLASAATLVARKRFAIKPVWWLFGALIVLFPPAIFSLLRTMQSLTWVNITAEFQTTILERVFYIPLLSAVYHCEYVQSAGFWGVAGIPKLALLLGVEPINVLNILLTKYYPNPEMTTGLMNTGYVFAYYTYFGLYVFPVVLAMLWALDLALILLRRFNPVYLSPAIGCLMVSELHLTSIDYTTCLLSFGFIPIIAVVWLLNQRLGLVRREAPIKKLRLYRRST